jgi:transcriptional regulator with XRE-family HTH domain
MKLGEYINQKKLSQEAFGNLIEVSQAAVARFVNGQRMPRREIILRIAQITGGLVTANDFYELPTKKSKQSKKKN